MTFRSVPTRAALGALAAALVVCATTSVASAAPEDRGPYAVTEWDAGMITADGTRIRTRVLYSTAAPPGPLVGIMHGNLREGRFHMELAQTFASRGLVVVLPDMPCGVGGCDHDANAR